MNVLDIIDDNVELVEVIDVNRRNDVFFTFVEKSNDRECWVWLGVKNNYGYGIFSFNGVRYIAHRLMYELCYGKFDGRLLVRHNCDNPSCVNPKHLYLGTQQDNMNDMIRRGRNGFRFIEGLFSDDEILLIHGLFYSGKTKSEIISEVNLRLSNRKINKYQLETVLNLE